MKLLGFASLLVTSAAAFAPTTPRGWRVNLRPKTLVQATSILDLPSWSRDSSSYSEITKFVDAVTNSASVDYVAPEDRIAVTDNDGTLWSEKPDYFQKYFINERSNDETLEPGFTEPMLDYTGAVDSWISTATHPDEGCLYTDMVYKPMIELLDYLRKNEFKIFIVSGGGIDFIRPWAPRTYGIPMENVVGSSFGITYDEDSKEVIRVLPSQPEDEDASFDPYVEHPFVDDSRGKPVGIQTHIGRRPILALGNSDGDRHMVEYVTNGDGKSLGVILEHNDEEREYEYPLNEEFKNEINLDPKMVLVNMKDDWTTMWTGHTKGEMKEKSC